MICGILPWSEVTSEIDLPSPLHTELRTSSSFIISLIFVLWFVIFASFPVSSTFCSFTAAGGYMETKRMKENHESRKKGL